MSLKVWLPLDGDLRNLGTSDIEVVNNGATIDDAGKIGKCYSFNSQALYGSLSGLNDYTQISGCCWVYLTNLNSAQYFMHLGGQSSYPCKFSIDYEKGIRFQVNGTEYSSGITLLVNTWNHIAVTWNGTEAKLYINGINQMDKNTSGTFDASEHFAIGARTNSVAGNTFAYYITDNGKLNDVRIYDHCLSPAEVKEISRGLTVHYKLDNNGRPNLFTSDAARPITIAAGATSAYSSYTYIDTAIKDNGIFKEGTEITVTYDYTVDSITEESKTTAYVYSQLNGSALTNPRINQTIIRDTTSGHIVEGFRVTAEQATYTNTFRIRWRLMGGTEGDKVTLTNVRLYLGTPAELETVSDSSGYGHNGLAMDNPEIVLNTARYSSATSFNGENQFIRAYRAGMLRDAITVTLWGYQETWLASPGNMISCTQGGGWNFENNSNRITFACGTGDSANTYKSAAWANHPFSSLSAGWHMFTGTYDGFTTKLYVDGELVDTNEAYTTKTPLYYHSSNGIFIGAEANANQNTPAGNYFAGNISDVRIYATALSADDILELYHTSAKIDNEGGIHAFEFIENGGNKITKTGLVEAANVCEIDGLSYLKYDPNVYIEPDGSCWVRIYHHNNPGAGSFSSTDDFAHSVYIDENRWFNVEVCDHVDTTQIDVINKNDVVENSYINSSGNVTETNGWYYTNYIAVKPHEAYQTVGLSRGGSGTYIGIYKPDKTVSRTILIVANEDNKIYIQDDEAYMRLSIRNLNSEFADAHCYKISTWEFMVKGRFTEDGDDWKLRWIQTVNPMTAAYADVAAANVNKITGNGYDEYPSAWGGLYAKKASAYLTTNNGNSGNWWGAVGSYSVYQNGIPGWGPSGTVTTTGFNDLYLRIDNLNNDAPPNTKTTKNNLWVAHHFIEK